MNIYLSEPRDIPPSPIQMDLLARWGRTHDTISPDSHLEVHMALPHEVHGDRLTRLWQEIYSLERTGEGPPDHLYLITENDFLIKPAFLRTLEKWPWPELSFLAAPYSIRSPDSEIFFPPHTPPLVGAWFLAFNLTGFTDWPPLDWLGPAGPYNDAANLAFAHWKGNHQFLAARDCGPDFLGVSYTFKCQFVGTHAFWARELGSPPDTILLPQRPDYTVAQHVAGIRRLL